MERSFRNNGGSLVVHDRGACVTSWVPAATGEAPVNDVLFTSRSFAVDRRPAGESPNKETYSGEAHAGIPICAPWFSGGRAGVDVPRKHGLVRWVDWHFDGAAQEPGASDVSHAGNPSADGGSEDSSEWTRLSWHIAGAELESMPGSESYPTDMEYRYDVGFGLRSGVPRVDVMLTISSPTQDVIVDAALHTYYRVQDAQTVRLSGLEGCTIDDLLAGKKYTITSDLDYSSRDAVIYSGAASAPHMVFDRGWDRLRITPINGSNIVLWNPGEANTAKIETLARDEWKDFFCVEVGNVLDDARTISAGTSLSFGFSVEHLGE
ncbi:MAG: hypothetical protein PUK40_01560 [Actinomycetaceae bacterium]|nr:hypothetical protein [Arcanobacterium sp.]MDD7504630.1 hypothetical protein [Actinomycetaceae bacterium]MDY6143054.1 hypothetical protein [Arcanobacterium sp.]